MSKHAPPVEPTTPEPMASSPASAPRFSLLGASGIALTAFMVGLYVGTSFLAPSAPPPTPASPASDLPPGHPAVDPNNPVPAPPLNSLPSTSGAAAGSNGATDPASNVAPPPGVPKDEGGYDLAFDDPAVRAAIAGATDYAGLVHIGNEQFDARHPTLAIPAYEKALKIHPFDPDVQTDLGVMYRAVHRYDDAMNAFRKAANMDPKHAQSRYNLGVVLATDEKDPKGAIAAWKDYLRIAPTGPQAEQVKRNIADLERQAKKP